MDAEDLVNAVYRLGRFLDSGRQIRLFSALFSNLEHGAILALESFGNLSRFPVFLPFHPSPDRALNRKSRRLSVPDRKSSLENRVRGYSTERLATQE
jgi:hypothetical protein